MSERLDRATLGDASARTTLDIRDREGVDAALRRARAATIELVVHTAAQPSHDWAAREPLTDFTVNAIGTLNLLEAAREHCPDAHVHLHLHEQGLRRPAEPPAAASSSRRAGSCPRTTAWYDGIDETMSIDQCTHSLFGASKVAADVLVQEYGRYFGMQTVCFRGGCLTGPQHSGAAAARLPRLPHALHRDRRPVHDLRLQGQAGPRQHPRLRRGRARSTPSTQTRGPARSTTSAAAAQSNCSMLEAIALCEEIAGRELDYTLSDQARIGDHHLVRVSDLRTFKRDYPEWRHHVRHRATCCAEIHESQRRALGGEAAAEALAPEALGRHPRPQRGGLDRRRRSRPSRARLAEEEHRLRDRRRRRRTRSDRTAEIVARLAEARPRRALRAQPEPRTASGSPCARGLDAFTGDAVAIVMADLSDAPDDLVAYYRLLEAGYDCAFGSRFMRGGAGLRLPAGSSSSMNRLVNVFIRVLFGHGYNDTTNAFKAYRREVIENVQPLLSHHFNLTVELPLKAVVRGHSYAITPDLAGPTARPASASCKLQEMGSRVPLHHPDGVPRAPPQPRRLPATRDGPAPGTPLASRHPGRAVLPGRWWPPPAYTDRCLTRNPPRIPLRSGRHP